jgi:hypothetical protein
MLVSGTQLNLLAADGAIVAIFVPTLTSAQYDELAQFVLNDTLWTRRQLCDRFEQLANEWAVKFSSAEP